MKLSQYAKKQSICYRTAFRHWKMGLIRGYQLETGFLIKELKEKAGIKDSDIDLEAEAEDSEVDACN